MKIEHELRAGFALSLSISMALLGGCYEAHLCGHEEDCNLLDDDCDGLVDEGIVSDDGMYRQIENCGTCGIDCRREFPTADEVACLDATEGPVCRLISCPEGTHLAGEGACEPDVVSLCLPCTEDVDCSIRMPGARCLSTASGATRCGTPCGPDTACPRGFECLASTEPGSGQCVPSSGLCGCNEGTMDVELACLLESPTDAHRCAGVQRCGADGPSACEPALVETCDAQDDDCDGSIDEDFRDDAGRYVARLHCGGCAMPCVEPRPNMLAECLPNGPGVRCDIACLDGFVDVNRILADGCECERWDGVGPPPTVGGDANCDGIPDDTNDFVYVTQMGSDTNPGTLARPMRTIEAAIGRAAGEGKDVLVARGIYQGPVHVGAGVSVFGGYSPDFRDRDLALYPVLLERADDPGLPALICDHITTETHLEGLEVQGGDAAVEGNGSTAVLFVGCGPRVMLRDVTVVAGRGLDGLRGDDSSTNLLDWGLMSLTQLDGASGTDGRDGTPDTACTLISAGTGGRHSCRTTDVGGGDGGGATCPGAICTNGRPCGNAGCTDFTSGGVCDLAAARAAATPNPAAGAGRGPRAGLAGELTYNAPTNRGVCNFCDDNPTLPREGGSGDDGGEGTDGGGGLGCPGGPTIAPDGRVTGSGGADGTAGSDGGGGGGGTAGGGYEVIGGTDGTCGDRAGGSGGGGGSGGCGAPGADGGNGGGYSIGILVRLDAGMTAGPTFERVRIVTASGGRGGDGGIGADGGAAGIGAAGGVGRFWCARTGGRGGDGGRGGSGGGGGGGCGGGSHGVLISAPSGGDTYRDMLIATLMIESAGIGGDGGRGGFAPGRAGTPGGDGTAEPVLLTR